MANKTKVLLEYQSKNAKNFIRDANNAANAVGKLNRNLLITKTIGTFKKQMQAGGKDIKQFEQYAKIGQKSVKLLQGEVQNLGVSVVKEFSSAKSASEGFNKAIKLLPASTQNISKALATTGATTVLKDGIAQTTNEANKAIPIVKNFFGEFIKNTGTQESVKNLGKFNGSLELIGTNLQKVKPNLSSFFGILKNTTPLKDFGGALDILKQGIAAIPPQIKIAVAAFIGFKVASKILEVIGKRAAALTGIADSFDRLSESAGLSTTYLEDFAKQADNQLTQAELLTLSNKALAGSQGEFQKNLADSLPTFLEFARVRAAATGEDVNFLFESLITGVKKTQPLILDNLGLVVDLNEVYTEYAVSLGKTKEQLTGVEQQEAVRQSTLKEAIRNINILGEATLSNADKMSARSNLISDILDNISLSVQPLLSVFLDIELFFLSMLNDTLKPVIDIMGSVISIFSQFATLIFNYLKPAFEFVFVLVQALLSPFVQIFRVVEKLTEVFVGFFNTINIVEGVLRPFITILQIVGTVFKTIADVIIGVIEGVGILASGVGQVIGKFNIFQNAGKAINERLLETKELIITLGKALVYGLGQAFASLVNTAAKAARNILKVVADLAQGIADFLIGESPPPKGPLSKIDTGGAKTFEAFLDGFTAVSLRPVKEVAKQVDADLGKIGTFSLPKVENRLAQLDLALRPFSEQLEIAKSRFEAISAPAEAALNAIDRQLNTAVEALVAGDESAKSSVQALDAQRAAIQKNLELQQQQVDFAQIELALAQSKQTEERTLLEIQKKRLGGQKITEKEAKAISSGTTKAPSTSAAKTGGSGGVGSGGIESATAPTPTGVSEFGNLFLEGFGDTLNLDVFSEIGTEQERLGVQSGRIVEGLTGLPDRLAQPFTDAFGENGTIKKLFNGIFGEEGFIKTGFNNLFGEDGSVTNSISNAFGEEGTVKTAFSNFFGEEGTLSGLLTTASGFFTTFGNGASAGIAIVTNLLTGEEGFLATLESVFGEEGSIKTLTDTSFQLFTDFYDNIFGEAGAFSGIATALQTTVISPFLTMLGGIQNAINSVLGYLETTVNNILTGLSDLVENIPENLRGPLGGLVGLQVAFTKIDFALPEIQIGGAAKGGLFTGGMLEVGEKGREFVTSADKMAVFPNNFVTAIESLENVLVRSMYFGSAGSYANNSTVNNNQNTNNFNFNGNPNDTTVRQQFNNFVSG